MGNKFLTTIFCLFAIVISFFSIFWSWFIILANTAQLLIFFAEYKRRKYSYIPEISPTKNDLIKRYGHFYNKPFVCLQFAASASALAFSGIIITIINSFKDFSWFIIILGIIHLIVSGYLSMFFNPTYFLKNAYEATEHTDLINYFNGKLEELHKEKYGDDYRPIEKNINKNYKVGDKVKWVFQRGMFRIIASKETPYMHFGRDKIFPKEECDFVIEEINILLPVNNEFTVFHHVNKEDLE